MDTANSEIIYRAQVELLPDDSWRVSLWDDRRGKCVRIVTRPTKRSAIRAAHWMVRMAKFRAGEKRWWRSRILSKS